MPTNGRPAADSLVAAVQEAHREIKKMLNDVAADRDPAAFDRLAHQLGAHEAAEQKVVHPLTRRAAGGEGIVSARIHEEQEGEAALKKLTAMGTEDPAFDRQFESFRAAVLEHATNEEQSEHPLLESVLDPDESRHAADEFRSAQTVSD